MPKTCIWIDATGSGDFEKFQFKAIERAADGIADVYLVTNLSPGSSAGRHVNISNDEIFAAETNIKNVTTLVPGNFDLKLLSFVRRPELSTYSNFVRIEFDCVFSGDLRDTIRQLVELSAKYDVGLSSSFPKADYSSDWPWWETFENWKDPTLPHPGDLYGAFMPVLMFNRTFVEHYDRYLRLGWRGHAEILAPSVAHWSSLSIIDFGTDETFHIDSSVFTVHRPKEFDSSTSQFFHPIKGFEDFRRLPTRILKNYMKYNEEDAKRLMSSYASATISPPEFDLFKLSILSSDSALIYGSLSLLEVACSFGIQTLDFLSSDRADIAEILGNSALTDHINFGNLSATLLNIGKTTSLGTPAFPEEPAKWRRYTHSLPDKQYDTIVLAGRFRVALAAEIYRRCLGKMRPKLIMTDFWNSTHYHDILDLFHVSDSAGNTVLLEFREDMLDRADSIFDEFSTDYR